MFTIRFNRHGEAEEYKSHSVDAYDVSYNEDGEANVLMVLAKEGAPEFNEQVGDEAPFGVAYVTNSASRTIDVIKQLPDAG